MVNLVSRTLFGSILISILILTLLLASCASGPRPNAPSPNIDPAELAKGETLYDKSCTKCHSKNGIGTEKGPSFLHQVYVPNHHGDQSFYIAVRSGSKAHHWNFGDMPPVKGLTDDDVGLIIQYVRALQQQAGLF